MNVKILNKCQAELLGKQIFIGEDVKRFNLAAFQGEDFKRLNYSSNLRLERDALTDGKVKIFGVTNNNLFKSPLEFIIPKHFVSLLNKIVTKRKKVLLFIDHSATIGIEVENFQILLHQSKIDGGKNE